MSAFMRLMHRRIMATVLIGGGIFLILSGLIAIGPALSLQRIYSGRAVEPVDPMVTRGRALYLAEGCGYCHSQFVRAAYADARFGRPSVALDYVGESPPLLGTQRTGPDLANVGQRQPSWMWNLIHLYNPRAMVPPSIMPPFPWYFDLVDADTLATVPQERRAFSFRLDAPFMPAGLTAVPRQEALDLTAYIRSLRQEF